MMKLKQCMRWCALVVMAACTTPEEKKEEVSGPKVFEKVAKSTSNIQFSNDLKEDSIINYFTYPYIYMGGGVATGDINNDGLADIFFTGNMVENKLYLNKGDLSFEDITETARVGGDDRWMTGVTMADVNADGWLDIYVSVSGKFTTKKNLLYINQGLNDAGVPTFSEEAAKYGIDDEGSSTQATFFDYDLDGDVDLYVANYPFTHFKTPNYAYKFAIDKKDPLNSDRLYQNTGDGFVDVTEEAGLLNFGLSLSGTTADFNQDGWPDLYVSNDFASPDYFYFNNGDGTFTDRSQEVTNHTAFFGMGTDAADFNNDGLIDLLQLDMTPEDNRRNKANMASMDIPGFWEIVGLDLGYQYMQNALQLNGGVADDGLPHFGDVSRLSGIALTDWSWAALMTDLDNDGWKDIFITNGTRRDINNKDYFNRLDARTYQEKQESTELQLAVNIPAEPVDNFAYRNNGDLTFTHVSADWGLSHVGYSNGASYADLDNDGDLELIVNNIDEPVSVFKNLSTENGKHYLQVEFEGSENNPLGLGAKVEITADGQKQVQELTMTRGFQSSVAPMMTFGLGNTANIEKLEVTWPGGNSQTLTSVKGDQLLKLTISDAQDASSKTDMIATTFTNKTKETPLDFVHRENTFNDYDYEVLLPHQYSRNGPGLARGDVNGDGLDDVFVGGATGQSGALLIQQSSGGFSTNTGPWEGHRSMEDLDATLFDADADGDLDLYVVSGGNETVGTARYQDRLYLNDGQGSYTYAREALPAIANSGSKVKPGDFDGDGDMDLFVGGRIVPRKYPLPATSLILRNESEKGVAKFTNVGASVCPALDSIGMVTDAEWIDYNGDQALDLVVVGEWMPITVFQNDGNGVLIDQTESLGLEKTLGWWYSIAAEDFDGDGDMDLAAGNLGLNYKYQATEEQSFDVYANDYDKNGSLDIVLGYYQDGTQYPLRGRQCSSEQIPAIKYKYKDYNSFAEATLIDIYTEDDLDASLHLKAYTFASMYLQNDQGQSFQMSKLPNEVQISNINSILPGDFNGDGNMDMILAGNMHTSEIETTRNDASYGAFLEGDGAGNFKAIPYSESGFYINGEVKDMEVIATGEKEVVIAARNNGPLEILEISGR
ncbi:MAG: VCBS repeat-containing protein [Cytophagales bacterium]|nr:VCBS repeat-containing protein [Cytophagales bacterium]